MNIVYSSAVEYWLSHPLKKSVDEFSKPVHVMVPDVESRRYLKDYSYHVQPGNLPKGSFIKLNPFLSVCSPELCFLQAALFIKSFPRLVCFANDLCAIYVKDSTLQYQQRQRESITSTAEIRHYLESVTGVHGIKHARKAIKYSVDRSNSPMESKLAVLCRLPFRLGGYSLPEPKMNYEIFLSAEASRHLQRESIKCDMVWPDRKVALEYESNLTHLSITQHGYDKSRATALQLSGYRIVYVTSQDLKSFSAVENVFQILRRTLGLRKNKDVLAKNEDIRRQAIYELLFSGNYIEKVLNERL